MVQKNCQKHCGPKKRLDMVKYKSAFYVQLFPYLTLSFNDITTDLQQVLCICSDLNQKPDSKYWEQTKEICQLAVKPGRTSGKIKITHRTVPKTMVHAICMRDQ